MGAVLDVSNAPPEFRLAAAGAAALTPDLRRALGKSVRAEIVPMAVRAYSQEAGAQSTGNRLPYVVARSLRVTARAGVITGVAFGGARRLSGGATVADLTRPTEFGSTGKTTTTYRRRAPRGGASHTVTRHTANAFTPRRSRGRFIWPATYTRVAPRVLAVWTRVTQEFLDDAWKGSS